MNLWWGCAILGIDPFPSTPHSYYVKKKKTNMVGNYVSKITLEFFFFFLMIKYRMLLVIIERIFFLFFLFLRKYRKNPNEGDLLKEKALIRKTFFYALIYHKISILLSFFSFFFFKDNISILDSWYAFGTVPQGTSINLIKLN